MTQHFKVYDSWHVVPYAACARRCWTIRATMPTSKKNPPTMSITVIQLAGFQLMMDVFSIDLTRSSTTTVQ
jgi:hypothetical protein